MIRNPYQKVALSSTIRKIIFVLSVVMIIIFGIFLGQRAGTNTSQDISNTRDYSGNTDVDGYVNKEVIFAINLAYALGVILTAIAIIIIRHDILGVVAGIVLLIFVFFMFPVGAHYFRGSKNGIDIRDDLTLFTLLTDAIKS